MSESYHPEGFTIFFGVGIFIGTILFAQDLKLNTPQIYFLLMSGVAIILFGSLRKV
jgi:hypothetical protein